MFTQLSEIIRRHLGWCPNAGTIHTAPPVIPTPPVAVTPVQPGSGAGGSGRLDRSFILATGSIRILLGNRWLLWFSFLTGLVLLFSFATTYAIQILSGVSPLAQTGLIPTADTPLLIEGSPEWLTLTFVFQLTAMSGTAFLFAALVICVTRLFTGQMTTLREGLSHAGRSAVPITVWSVVMAAAGTAQSAIMALYPENLLLTLIVLLVVCLIGFLTTFVIPLIVLEGRDLVHAVVGSFTLFRRTWAEILLCVFIFWLFAFIIGVLSLIPAVAIGFPSGNVALLGITMGLYMLVLMVLTMVGTTLMGIILVGLYHYAGTGRLPEMFKGKTVEVAPV